MRRRSACLVRRSRPRAAAGSVMSGGKTTRRRKSQRLYPRSRRTGFAPGRMSPGHAAHLDRAWGPAIVTLLEPWRDTEVVAFVFDLPAFGALVECRRRSFQAPEQSLSPGSVIMRLATSLIPDPTGNFDCYGIGMGQLQRPEKSLRRKRRARDRADAPVVWRRFMATVRLLRRSFVATQLCSSAMSRA
jgi:hypothetical protein